MSIIMACFNAERYVVEAACSVRAGARAFSSSFPYELIIVDDGSRDGTGRALDQIESLEDPHIRVVRLPENKGQSHARNLAIGMARYDHIMALDADDKLGPDYAGYAQRAVHILAQHDELFSVYCHTRAFGAREGTCILPAFSEAGLPLRNTIPVHGVFRKGEAMEIGAYREDLRFCEDWELWLALSSERLTQGRARHAYEVPETHYFYRQHLTGANVSEANKIPRKQLYTALTERTVPLYEAICHTSDPHDLCTLYEASRPSLCAKFLAVARFGPMETSHFIANQVKKVLANPLTVFSSENNRVPS
ncbi:MAG: glycosyltransferase [Pseudobdellovibrionaceae bacterium]